MLQKNVSFKISMEETFENLNNQLQGLCVSYYQHKDSTTEVQWCQLIRLGQTIRQKINLKKEVESETLTNLSELVNLIFDLENKLSLELARSNADDIGPLFLTGLDPLRNQVDDWPPPTHSAAVRVLENVEGSLIDLAFYFGVYKDLLAPLQQMFLLIKARFNSVKINLKLEEMLGLSCKGNVFKFQGLLGKFREALEVKGINTAVA